MAWDPLAEAGLVHLLSHDTSLRLVRHSWTPDGVLTGEPPTGPAPDVVVLFDQVPGGRTSQVIRRLREYAGVLLVCGFEARPCPLTAIRAGASGVVSARDSTDLHRAVRAVAAGGVYVGAGLAGLVRGRIAEATNGRMLPAGRVPALAPREAETLRWLADGYTHAQAARRMRVAPGTVDTYAKRLRLKLDARNKAQLTLRAVELGYASRPERLARLRALD